MEKEDRENESFSSGELSLSDFSSPEHDVGKESFSTGTGVDVKDEAKARKPAHSPPTKKQRHEGEPGKEKDRLVPCDEGKEENVRNVEDNDEEGVEEDEENEDEKRTQKGKKKVPTATTTASGPQKKKKATSAAIAKKKKSVKKSVNTTPASVPPSSAATNVKNRPPNVHAVLDDGAEHAQVQKLQQQQQQQEQPSEVVAFAENCDDYCNLRKWAADTLVSLETAAWGKDCVEDKAIARDALEREKDALQQDMLIQLQGELRDALAARHAILCGGNSTNDDAIRRDQIRGDAAATVVVMSTPAVTHRGSGAPTASTARKGGGSSSTATRKKGNNSSTTLIPPANAVSYPSVPVFCVRKEECEEDLNAVHLGLRLKLK